MKYGIFGDIHGNLEGLEAVLAAMSAEGVEDFICLGDVVGYGADPNGCCARVRETCSLCLLGNHDHAALGHIDLSWFNVHARAAAEWTRQELDPDHMAWLSELTPVAHLDDFVMVHSALPQPYRWVYITRPDLAENTMRAADKPLVFVGHTHITEVYRQVGEAPVRQRSFRDGGEVFLADANRYVINPGSCGQPRDQNVLASYAVYDTAAHRVGIRRVPYDIDTAAAKIEQAGLPSGLAKRLFRGI